MCFDELAKKLACNLILILKLAIIIIVSINTEHLEKFFFTSFYA